MPLICALAPDTHHAPDSVSTAPLIMIIGRYEKLLGARDHADMTFPASNDRHRIVRANTQEIVTAMRGKLGKLTWPQQCPHVEESLASPREYLATSHKEAHIQPVSITLPCLK